MLSEAEVGRGRVWPLEDLETGEWALQPLQRAPSSTGSEAEARGQRGCLSDPVLGATGGPAPR